DVLGFVDVLGFIDVLGFVDDRLVLFDPVGLGRVGLDADEVVVVAPFHGERVGVRFVDDRLVLFDPVGLGRVGVDADRLVVARSAHGFSDRGQVGLGLVSPLIVRRVGWSQQRARQRRWVTSTVPCMPYW